jgi:hypothetical protein
MRHEEVEIKNENVKNALSFLEAMQKNLWGAAKTPGHEPAVYLTRALHQLDKDIEWVKKEKDYNSKTFYESRKAYEDSFTAMKEWKEDIQGSNFAKANIIVVLVLILVAQTIAITVLIVGAK